MISQYITGYYNPYRTHQHNGGLPSNKAEENYWLTSKILVNNTWPLQGTHHQSGAGPQGGTNQGEGRRGLRPGPKRA